MSLAVLSERCDQCLYGPDKIVSNERRAEILRGLNASGGWFVCHKASIAGVECACRGDWDQRKCGHRGQISEWLGVVRFVDEADLERLPRVPRQDEAEDWTEDV